MEFQIPYGHTSLRASLPDHFRVKILESPNPLRVAQPQLAVQKALENLLGGQIWDNFCSAQTVAIAVNDKTRPVPHAELLPPLLKRLSELGIPDSSITFYIAVGSHPPMVPTEFHTILPPEILRRYRVVSHNSEDQSLLISLGETSRGTPVWTNRDYFNSNFKIVVGNIEPHQFAGFSGGVKTAAIGLSGLSTINANHSLLTHPDSRLGNYETNPSRQDIEEIGQKIKVHLALNAILNQQREIVNILAGDPREVVVQGLNLSRLACQVAVPEACGLVIASPGGHPKDINVYQSQKALAHATLITRPGGTIILAAACPEGSGSAHYENWMVGKLSYAEVIEQFAVEGFRIGPHKAYQIARDASRINLCFYTDMDAVKARALLLNPVANLQAAIDKAVADLPPDELVGILPHASSTIPYLEVG